MPVRQANDDGEQNEYHRTKEIGLIQSMMSGCGCSPTRKTVATRSFLRRAGRFGEPQWPDLKPAKIFRLAFRDKGRLIDSVEHPLFQEVGGP